LRNGFFISTNTIFFSKYGHFTPLIPWGFQGILVNSGKKYGIYRQESRVIEKMVDAAFTEKIY